MNVQTVSIALIASSGRLRKLDRAKVRQLADSILEIGLLNPVTVCAAGSEFTLVAGRHRLEAAKVMDWREIPATVVTLDDADRHLAEIDENLIRNDLSDLERSEHLAARKGWYEAKHPGSVNPNKRGGPGRGNKTMADSAIVSYAADTAAKTGVSERTIREDVQIAESIPEDVRDAIRETLLAESKTDLLAIARLPEAAQREIISTVDLTDKLAVRRAVATHRSEHPALEPDIEPDVHVTEVETTVEGFARAAITLFTADECRRLIALIREGYR